MGRPSMSGAQAAGEARRPINRLSGRRARRPGRSGRPRSLLNLNYAAADTWPLLTPERSVPLTEDPDAFESLIVRGEATIVPRLANVPVRLPVPGARLGSIFQQQSAFIGRSFGAEE